MTCVLVILYHCMDVQGEPEKGYRNVIITHPIYVLNMVNYSSVGVRSQLVISDLNVYMLYFEQLLVATVIYDVYDATEYELNVDMCCHIFCLYT